MSDSAPHILVVGAGIFGATAALTLRRRGWAVTLVDPGPVPHPDASSTDVSKMVRMDYGADLFYHELAEASIDGWDRWNADGPRPLYHDEGYLVLAADPMEPGGYEHDSLEVLRARGYEPARIGGAELERRFPRWNGDAYPDGYLSPRGGWAESGAVVDRVVETATSEGVEVRIGRVEAIEAQESRVSGVRLAAGGAEKGEAGVSEQLACETVLVCAGAWTPELVPASRTLLTPVAQPVVHFGVDDPDDFRGPAFPPFAADISGSGWYGFPALDDGHVKLGHHGPGHVRAPHRRGSVGSEHVDRARAFLRRSIPSLADAPVVHTRVCMYCDTPDGDLLVDAVPGHDGLFVASGGSGHAFKFAPMIGEIVADAVEERENPWLHRFRWRGADPERWEAARQRTPKGSPS